MLKIEFRVYPLAAVQLRVNIGAQLLNFYYGFQRIFQHLWNRMCNNALWSIPTDSLGTYVECVR